MLRKLSIVFAAGLLSVSAYAQNPMHDTWDINAPNGEPMILGKPLPATATPSAYSKAPMHDTWDINAPNGDSMAAAPTAPAATHGDSAVHGHAASPAQYDRVIVVQPDTRYVNVKSGETILFKVGDKSFTWMFDPTVDHATFDLAQIAPQGLVARGVLIYCAPTEYERAG